MTHSHTDHGSARRNGMTALHRMWFGVNLLRGQPAPQGPSLRRAYLPFNALVALSVVVTAGFAWWAARARLARWAVLLVLMAVAITVALQVMGLSAALLSAFAPDLALVLATVGLLLCLPAAWRPGSWARHARAHRHPAARS